MQNIPRLRRALATFAALITSPVAWSAVSVAELERSCRTALDDNYRGVAAAVCDWYIDPCAMCGVETEPQWCVPADLTGAARARHFLTALAATQSDPGTPAESVVRTLLSREFPCDATPPNVPAKPQE